MTSPSIDTHTRPERKLRTSSQILSPSATARAPHIAVRHRFAALLFTLLFSLLFTSSTLAQDKPKRRKPPPVEIVNVDLGWGSGMLSGERWQPATVWVTSQDKPFSGILTLTCQQDGTQNAVMYVGPVATTPGQITPVEVIFSPAFNARELVFTLAGPGYSTKLRYARQPQGDDLQMPRIGLARAGHAVLVGETSAKKALEIKQINVNQGTSAYNFGNPPNANVDPDQIWDNMFPANIQPGRLPMSWTAYESADMLVCAAEDLARVDPRIKTAISTWVQAGGRLIIRADQIGPAWPDFLSDLPAPISGTEQQVFTLGSDIKDLMPGIAATTHQARALNLTPEGQRLGWKTLYPAHRPSDDTPAGFLVAHGPAGLGMVTVIGFEPRNAAALMNDEAVKKVWRAIMTPTLTPRAKLGGHQQQYYWGGWGELNESETAGAINSSLDTIATIPPIGTGVFWAICTCMVGLALLVGPIDAKVLKWRKQSRYSWFTALMWICLAGTAAVLVPRVMRSGESIASRLTFADTICSAEGQPLRSAHLGLTGIFAGKPITVALEGGRHAAWARGVSANSNAFNSDTSLISLPDLHLPILSDDSGAALRTAWPETVDVPQWSFRTVSDLAPLAECTSKDIGAKVKDAGGYYEVTLTNLPEGAVVREAFLGIGDQWHAIAPETAVTAANARDRVFRVSTASPTHRSTAWNRTPHTSPDYWRPPTATPASLPWVRERGEAVDAMLAGGHFACVCVRLTDLPMDLTVQGVKNLQTKQTTMLRLLTPLETQQP